MRAALVLFSVVASASAGVLPKQLATDEIALDTFLAGIEGLEASKATTAPTQPATQSDAQFLDSFISSFQPPKATAAPSAAKPAAATSADPELDALLTGLFGSLFGPPPATAAAAPSVKPAQRSEPTDLFSLFDSMFSDDTLRQLPSLPRSQSRGAMTTVSPGSLHTMEWMYHPHGVTTKIHWHERQQRPPPVHAFIQGNTLFISAQPSRTNPPTRAWSQGIPLQHSMMLGRTIPRSPLFSTSHSDDSTLIFMPWGDLMGDTSSSSARGRGGKKPCKHMMGQDHHHQRGHAGMPPMPSRFHHDPAAPVSRDVETQGQRNMRARQEFAEIVIEVVFVAMLALVLLNMAARCCRRTVVAEEEDFEQCGVKQDGADSTSQRALSSKEHSSSTPPYASLVAVLAPNTECTDDESEEEADEEQPQLMKVSNPCFEADITDMYEQHDITLPTYTSLA